jgi:hypothetical protein
MNTAMFTEDKKISEFQKIESRILFSPQLMQSEHE